MALVSKYQVQRTQNEPQIRLDRAWRFAARGSASSSVPSKANEVVDCGHPHVLRNRYPYAIFNKKHASNRMPSRKSASSMYSSGLWLSPVFRTKIIQLGILARTSVAALDGAGRRQAVPMIHDKGVAPWHRSGRHAVQRLAPSGASARRIANRKRLPAGVDDTGRGKTAFIIIGAGARALTIIPSGAKTVIGRKAPSFFGICPPRKARIAR